MSGEPGDDPRFEGAREPRVFDTDLIGEPSSAVPVQETLVLGTGDNATRGA